MNLKKSLLNNTLSIGSWLTIGHPSVVEIMSSAGFEWLVVDLEHSSIDLTMAQILISTIQANGMQALVRVSKNEEVIIKRVLDIGADGIIVPMIKNKEEAKQAVGFAYYPPFGKRGVGLYRAQNYGIGFEEYKEKNRNETIVIAQIEHVEAVKNIEDILSTDGIDGIIVGPYDLSGSMGKPGQYDDEDVKEALERVKAACFTHEKPLGFHVIQSDHAKLQEKIDEGYTFLAFSLDFFFLGDKARDEMTKLKGAI